MCPASARLSFFLMAKFSLKEYLMGRDVSHKDEYTEAVKKEAEILLARVNNLFADLGHTSPASISSGWRPASLNAKVAGAAKSSYHTRGMAMDIKDVSGELYKLVTSKPELLRKYGFWVEHRDATPTWLHIDRGSRTDRPSRIFKP